jgi:deoxycytidylate deaminase
MWRDQTGSDLKHGQHVSEAFHRADVFVDASDVERLRSALSRFIELVFGNTLHTPHRSEYAMFHAKAAALRSSELGRQVGACISTDQGDVVSLGTNEVPRGGGGLYWAGDKPDFRQFQLGSDSNDDHKRSLIQDTLTRLEAAGWLNQELSGKSGEELATLEGLQRLFAKDSKIANLIEYGRAVHGEMAALVDAARRGVSVAGCIMHVTTFPCHLCARHIVAAGIKAVIYIEPYPKSLTTELYPDSIAVEDECSGEDVVRFIPFVGVSPRQYLRLFEASKRKDSTTGKVLKLDGTALPRYSSSETLYIEREKSFLITLLDSLKEVNHDVQSMA